MFPRMRFATLSLLLIFCSVADAELYRWVDKKGRVHFSDRPLDSNAESYTPAPIPVVPSTPVAPLSSKPEEPQETGYESLTVISPENDQVFTPDIGSIAISIDIQPVLRAEHSIVLFLNGKNISSGSSTHFSLPDMYRGTHTVYAAVEDGKGKTLIRSDPVEFHVQRHHL